jgi:glycosyltransferase involved in cell wall biosynthesis
MSSATLRVLLFSPVRDVDPASGDVVYTETLLENPPEGVEFTTYVDAIANGTVRVRGRKPPRGSFTATDLLLLGIRTVEWTARRAGAMFREPSWYVTIDDSAFDVVHQHLFSVRQVGSRLPVVSSAGCPLEPLYEAHDGWTPRRARTAARLERAYVSLTRQHHPVYSRRSPGLRTVYTEHFAAWLRARGVPTERMRVVGQGLPDREPPPPSVHGRIGFVGRDFHRKGGDLVVESFRRLRSEHPGMSLLIATTAQYAASISLTDGIEILVDPGRTRVLEELDRLDVLVMPSRLDCGAPYTVLEALRAGTPVVLSDCEWLDSRLVAPAVQRCEPHVGAVTDAIATVLDRLARDDLRDQARKLFLQSFAIDDVTDELRSLYLAVSTRELHASR